MLHDFFINNAHQKTSFSHLASFMTEYNSENRESRDRENKESNTQKFILTGKPTS